MRKNQISQPVVAAQPNNPNHALVIGGSIAGLLAARVLADHSLPSTAIGAQKTAGFTTNNCLECQKTL